MTNLFALSQVDTSQAHAIETAKPAKLSDGHGCPPPNILNLDLCALTQSQLHNALKAEKSNLLVNLKSHRTQGLLLTLQRPSDKPLRARFCYRAAPFKDNQDQHLLPVLYTKPLIAIVHEKTCFPSHLPPRMPSNTPKNTTIGKNTRTPPPVKVKPTLSQSNPHSEMPFKLISLFDISDTPTAFALSTSEARILSEILQLKLIDFQSDSPYTLSS